MLSLITKKGQYYGNQSPEDGTKPTPETSYISIQPRQWTVFNAVLIRWEIQNNNDYLENIYFISVVF
jgi:hypothetical protein